MTKRFYVIETLKVGHFVDAETEQEARDLVQSAPATDFDVLEDSSIVSIEIVDAEFPFSLED
jgi:hypothetical protein